jgi:branched-chain amino acid transport system permease protein
MPFWRGLAVISVVILTILVPVLSDRNDLINLLFRFSLFIILAQSWNILAGLVGQLSLGHATFFGLGALVMRTLWLHGIAFVVALLLGGLAATAFAMLIGVPTFRLRGAYFAIGTLGMSEALRITVAQNLPLITSLSPEQIIEYNLATRYYLALGLAIATVGAAYLLWRSPLSLGLQAIREDEEAAQATGINVLQHKLIAFAISSFFAGLAGGAFAFHQVSYYPAATFSPIWTFDALLITFVGGLGTLIGPVIGAVFFILVQEQLALTLEQAHPILFGALFIIVVLVFPGGLLQIWNQLRKGDG